MSESPLAFSLCESRPMKLYTFFRSSVAFRMRIALNCKGLAYMAIFSECMKLGAFIDAQPSRQSDAS